MLGNAIGVLIGTALGWWAAIRTPNPDRPGARARHNGIGVPR